MRSSTRVVGVIAMTAVIVCLQGSHSIAQQPLTSSAELGFVPVAGVRVRQSGDFVEVQEGAGLLRANRFFGDFVLRFQFQLEPNTDGVVYARALFAKPAEGPQTGYRVHLTTVGGGSEPLGRVTAFNGKYSAEPVTAISLTDAASRWQDCELRAVGGTLTVRVNGAETTTASNLDQWIGYIGFQVRRGQMRFRNVQVESLPLASEGFPNGVIDIRQAAEGPKVIKEVRPVYSIEAMRAKASGQVVLSAIVRDDGTVGELKVIQPLHPDLDMSAMAATRQWRFQPARHDGKPVSVVVTVAMAFKIF